METISISGFGGFKEATFETAPIMVLIGEQATGKSIVAKLLYFFRSLGANPPVLTHDSEEDGRKWWEQEFATLFPPDDWGVGGFDIRYECNAQWVRISHPEAPSKILANAVDLKWSAFYSGAWAKWGRTLREVKSLVPSGDFSGWPRILRLEDEVRKDMEVGLGASSAFEQIFVPAGRGFFAQVSENIFALLTANKGDLSKSFDPFLLRFGRSLQSYKKNCNSLGFFDARVTGHGRFPSVREYVDRILKAKYVRENGQDILLHPDGRRVGLSNASSAQQESLPLLLTIGRVLAGGHDPGRDVYVEEPEAHIFPKSQQEIVELLAAAFNLNRDNVRFVITTHSPYILSTFGNLLQAGQRYAAPEHKRKLGKIIPQVFALRPGDVTAYALGGGQSRFIIDRETKLIKSNILDKVSMEIDKQFHRLLWET